MRKTSSHKIVYEWFGLAWLGMVWFGCWQLYYTGCVLLFWNFFIIIIVVADIALNWCWITRKRKKRKTEKLVFIVVVKQNDNVRDRQLGRQPGSHAASTAAAVVAAVKNRFNVTR